MNTDQQMAGMVLRFLELWELTREDQVTLLGGVLPDDLKTALAEDAELRGRVENLLRIYANLRVIFPRNPDLAHRWIRQPNRRFDGRTPLAIMKESIEGLQAISRHLGAEVGR